jgi:hypothetical protein
MSENRFTTPLDETPVRLPGIRKAVQIRIFDQMHLR